MLTEDFTEKLKTLDEKNIVYTVDFTKTFGSKNNEKIACSKINFLAEKGNVTVLLGENGAGKSTLLKSLCGTQYETSGKISVLGETDFEKIRLITAFVPEIPVLDLNLTVKETVYIEGMIHGLKGKALKENADFAFEKSELKDVLNVKASALSKGFRQRLSLAKALSFNPEVLILDEFSGGLDPSQIQKMRNTIKKLAEKKAVILSTHNLNECENLSDKVYILHKGQTASCGTTEEICSQFSVKTLQEAFFKITSETKD